MVAAALRPAGQTLVTSVLQEAITLSGCSGAAVGEATQHDLEKSIAQDIRRQRQQPTIPKKLFRSTIVRKYAAIISHQQGGGSGLASLHPIDRSVGDVHQNTSSPSMMMMSRGEHKVTVEKILSKHQRDVVWEGMIQEDLRLHAEMQDRAKRLREEQIRIQRETLDWQLEAQRREKAAKQQQECSEMRDLMRKQEEDEQIAKKKMVDLKAKQLEKRLEAEAISAKQIQEQNRQRQLQKQLDFQLANEFAAEGARLKNEEANRRAQSQLQIRNFVKENDDLLKHRREFEEKQMQFEESSLSRGRQSVLPTGESAPVNMGVLEKASLRRTRQERAAIAYMNEQKKRQEDAQQRDAHAVEIAAAEALRLEQQAELIRRSRLQEQSKYRQALSDQILHSRVSKGMDAEEDRRMRREIERNVQVGMEEEKRVKEAGAQHRQKNLEILKLQLDVEKRMREGFEVAPKVV